MLRYSDVLRGRVWEWKEHLIRMRAYHLPSEEAASGPSAVIRTQGKKTFLGQRIRFSELEMMCVHFIADTSAGPLLTLKTVLTKVRQSPFILYLLVRPLSPQFPSCLVTQGVQNLPPENDIFQWSRSLAWPEFR